MGFHLLMCGGKCQHIIEVHARYGLTSHEEHFCAKKSHQVERRERGAQRPEQAHQNDLLRNERKVFRPRRERVAVQPVVHNRPQVHVQLKVVRPQRETLLPEEKKQGDKTGSE